MSYVVIFIATGMLAYWASRTVLLIEGHPLDVEETLTRDCRWFRRLLFGLDTKSRHSGE